jgi:hypothetical protein
VLCTKDDSSAVNLRQLDNTQACTQRLRCRSPWWRMTRNRYLQRRLHRPQGNLCSRTCTPASSLVTRRRCKILNLNPQSQSPELGIVTGEFSGVRSWLKKAGDTCYFVEWHWCLAAVSEVQGNQRVWRK